MYIRLPSLYKKGSRIRMKNDVHADLKKQSRINKSKERKAQAGVDTQPASDQVCSFEDWRPTVRNPGNIPTKTASSNELPSVAQAIDSERREAWESLVTGNMFEKLAIDLKVENLSQQYKDCAFIDVESTEWLIKSQKIDSAEWKDSIVDKCAGKKAAFFIVNHNNVHWSIAVTDFNKNTISFYDTLESNCVDTKKAAFIKNFSLLHAESCREIKEAQWGTKSFYVPSTSSVSNACGPDCLKMIEDIANKYQANPRYQAAQLEPVNSDAMRTEVAELFIAKYGKTPKKANQELDATLNFLPEPQDQRNDPNRFAIHCILAWLRENGSQSVKDWARIKVRDFLTCYANLQTDPDKKVLARQVNVALVKEAQKMLTGEYRRAWNGSDFQKRAAEYVEKMKFLCFDKSWSFQFSVNKVLEKYSENQGPISQRALTRLSKLKGLGNNPTLGAALDKTESAYGRTVHSLKREDRATLLFLMGADREQIKDILKLNKIGWHNVEKHIDLLEREQAHVVENNIAVDHEVKASCFPLGQLVSKLKNGKTITNHLAQNASLSEENYADLKAVLSAKDLKRLDNRLKELAENGGQEQLDIINKMDWLQKKIVLSKIARARELSAKEEIELVSLLQTEIKKVKEVADKKFCDEQIELLEKTKKNVTEGNINALRKEINNAREAMEEAWMRLSFKQSNGALNDNRELSPEEKSFDSARDYLIELYRAVLPNSNAAAGEIESAKRYIVDKLTNDIELLKQGKITGDYLTRKECSQSMLNITSIPAPYDYQDPHFVSVIRYAIDQMYCSGYPAYYLLNLMSRDAVTSGFLTARMSSTLNLQEAVMIGYYITGGRGVIDFVANMLSGIRWIYSASNFQKYTSCCEEVLTTAEIHNHVAGLRREEQYVRYLEPQLDQPKLIVDYDALLVRLTKLDYKRTHDMITHFEQNELDMLERVYIAKTLTRENWKRANRDYVNVASSSAPGLIGAAACGWPGLVLWAASSLVSAVASGKRAIHQDLSNQAEREVNKEYHWLVSKTIDTFKDQSLGEQLNQEVQKLIEHKEPSSDLVWSRPCEFSDYSKEIQKCNKINQGINAALKRVYEETRSWVHADNEVFRKDNEIAIKERLTNLLKMEYEKIAVSYAERKIPNADSRKSSRAKNFIYGAQLGNCYYSQMLKFWNSLGPARQRALQYAVAMDGKRRNVEAIISGPSCYVFPYREHGKEFQFISKQQIVEDYRRYEALNRLAAACGVPDPDYENRRNIMNFTEVANDGYLQSIIGEAGEYPGIYNQMSYPKSTSKGMYPLMRVGATYNDSRLDETVRTPVRNWFDNF